MTSIEWVKSEDGTRGKTWNPATGCTAVSAGCDNCYAAELSRGRLTKVYTGRLPVVDTAENRADPFAVRLWPERIRQPAKWRNPLTIFVNSMSDMFHRDIPRDFLRSVVGTMLDVNRHTYQVLTKRPTRAGRFVRDNADLLPNGLPPHIWIGTSVEDERVAYRIRHLRAVPAAVRFLSVEPLLGPIDLTNKLDGIHWVIVGGESGPRFRAMDLAWARQVRDATKAQQVAFFFKQWGGRFPKAGGRTLDGRTWDEMPYREQQSAMELDL